MSGLSSKDVKVYHNGVQLPAHIGIDWAKVTWNSPDPRRYMETHLLRPDSRTYRCVMFDGPMHGHVIQTPYESLRPVLEFVQDPEPPCLNWKNPLSVYHNLEVPRRSYYEAKRIFDKFYAVLYYHRGG